MVENLLAQPVFLTQNLHMTPLISTPRRRLSAPAPLSFGQHAYVQAVSLACLPALIGIELAIANRVPRSQHGRRRIRDYAVRAGP
jgi:hypothetical protein